MISFEEGIIPLAKVLKVSLKNAMLYNDLTSIFEEWSPQVHRKGLNLIHQHLCATYHLLIL
jgi:hypothetical protein